MSDLSLLTIIEKNKHQLTAVFSNMAPLGADFSRSVMEGISSVGSGIAGGFSNISQFCQSESVTSAVGNLKSLGSEISRVSHDVMGPMLSSNVVYSSMLDYFGKFHRHVSEMPAVTEAIDGLAHTPGYGGAAFHRVSDGRHSIVGALEAVGTELPHLSSLDRFTEVSKHLWSDFHSSVGLPLFSFSSHESFKAFCEALKLTPHAVRDFLTINSTEMINSALTMIPVIFQFDTMQAVDFAKVAAKFAVLTISGGQAEVLGSVFSLSMLGKALYDVYIDGVSYLSILIEAGIEASWTTVSVAGFSLLPLPLSMLFSFILFKFREFVEAEGISSVFERVKSGLGEITSWLSDIDFSQLKISRA